MEQLSLSLYELNTKIKGILQDSLSESYWIRAEMSDVRTNQTGHCYLEFVERDAAGRNIVAKARGIIWASTFNILKPFFETTTNQPFASGLSVLVRVSVVYQEVYGLSLTVHDIDPSYTLGEQALNRLAILRKLEEEGVLLLNKELILPTPCQRIAIISSPTAAGYEDFCNQLHTNLLGLTFYTKLFPSIMQGERVEESIIASLERIYEHITNFDVVVIIRGGGAASELSCFDSYLLAASCAQFPLPIITGIGHERDETLLDIVAHSRAKTPTAAAELLIDRMNETANFLYQLEDILRQSLSQSLQQETVRITTLATQTSYLLKAWHKEQLHTLASLKEMLAHRLWQGLQNKKTELSLLEKHIELISPENILKKGYTLTLHKGKVVKKASLLKQGDVLTTMFASGKVQSKVE